MIKRWVLGVLGMAVLLAGCQSSNQPTATPTERPATVVPATPTVSTALAGCTVISPRPTPGPTERSIFPAVSAEDWVSGPEGATITFVEYSDFQ